MQAALHEKLATAGVDQFHRLCGGGMAVRNVHDLDPRQLDPRLHRHIADLALRADKDRHDQARIPRFDCAAERGGIARMHHQRGRGRQVIGRVDQHVMF